MELHDHILRPDFSKQPVIAPLPGGEIRRNLPDLITVFQHQHQLGADLDNIIIDLIHVKLRRILRILAGQPARLDQSDEKTGQKPEQRKKDRNQNLHPHRLQRLSPLPFFTPHLFLF